MHLGFQPASKYEGAESESFGPLQGLEPLEGPWKQAWVASPSRDVSFGSLQGPWRSPPGKGTLPSLKTRKGQVTDSRCT